MSNSELKILVEEPRVVSRSEGHHWFPHTLLKLKDGKLLLGFSICPDRGPTEDLVYGNPHVVFKSMDGGSNWFLQRYVRTMSDPWLGFPLDDGTILAYGGVYLKPSGETVVMSWRSCDDGETFEGPGESPISFPEDVGLVGVRDREPLKVFGRASFGGFGDSGTIPLENGDLLSTAGAMFEGDVNNRVCIVRSTDRGATWCYVSTVACDPEIPGEGFDENSLARFSNGELLCIMRTGSGRPMYQSRSTDQGETWSKPIPAGVVGVAPKLVLMSNGVLACSYGRVRPLKEGEVFMTRWMERGGRPYFSVGDEIMFSVDGGRTWTNHTSIYDGPSTGYTSMVEVRPGELLYAYDVLGFGWTRKNSIVVVNIEVEREQ